VSEVVVFVPGIWMPGHEMALLRRRVARCGFHTARFPYPSVRRDIGHNAALLQNFLSTLDAKTVHFVGHSMGGLVVARLFHDFPEQRPGRIVTLGSPLAGSYVARRLSGHALGRLILGRGREPLVAGLVRWSGGHELGTIAGTLAVGIGRLLGPGLPKPSDGTVAVQETHLAGETDSIELPVTHTGLAFSAEVARQVCAFLKTGRFVRERGA